MQDPNFVAIKGSERVAVPGAKAVGRTDADQWLEVTLKLRRRAPLPPLDGRPAGTLTHDELAAQYGADPEAVKRVADIFTTLGLTVISCDAETRSVKLGGPASAMEAAFQVKLMNYTHERGDYRGRVGVLQVPATVADVVEGVFGLDNRRAVRRKPAEPRRLLSEGAHTTASSKRPWFFPSELATAYDFPPGDGAGQTIGLIEFGGGFFPDDLAAFAKQAGLAQIPNVVPISVDHMPTDTNDEAVGEVMLDVEVVAGVCPSATVPVWFGQFTEKGWIDVLDAAIHDKTHKPQVLSISWGYAEDAFIWTQTAVDQVNEILQEAALLGITICVASGDDGSSDGITDGHAHVDFPSSSPFVLSVGGTLLRTGSHHSERVWKDGDGLRADRGGSTGSGVSTRLARPSWQAGLDVQSLNPGQIEGRIVPDVVANASAHTGYFTVVDGQAGITGGTSAAAPLWATLVARMNQSLATSGKKVGYFTPLLYGKSAGGSEPVGLQAFNDIHSGDNVTAQIGGFHAGKGFDGASGWGSPKGKSLLAELEPLL
jgi:kumamolisin